MKVKSLSHVRLFTIPWTAGSSVHGIFQARVLEWGAIAFSVIRYSMLNNGLPKSPYPSMLPYMTTETLQMWLRILRWGMGGWIILG